MSRCICGGMVPSTGNFCGFLDHAAQQARGRCELKGCTVQVPAVWRQRYALKREFQYTQRQYAASTDPEERAKLAEHAGKIAEQWLWL